jgi:hypothetical protein
MIIDGERASRKFKACVGALIHCHAIRAPSRVIICWHSSGMRAPRNTRRHDLAMCHDCAQAAPITRRTPRHLRLRASSSTACPSR